MRFETWDASLDRLPAYLAGGESNVFARKSELWTWITAKREKGGMTAEEWLSFMSTFLSTGSQQASGISDWQRDISPALLAYFEARIDPGLLSAIAMPETGAPETFPFLGHRVSTPFLWNLSTFETLRAVAGKAAPKYADVVEIGAGFGAAALMRIQTGTVRSYTVVDLADNLVNSLYYLKENLPDWTMELVDAPLASQQAERTIYFLTPGYISAIADCSYDLALNTDSIGEMDAETGRAYVDWVFNHLRPSGIFLSKNGHRRGPLHLPAVTAYGYERFNVVGFGPSPICSSAFDDFSHVAVLQKAAAAPEPAQWDWLEVLSNLYACGLTTDLTDISGRVAAGKTTTADEAFLDLAGSFFKGAAISPAGPLSYVLDYLLALRQGVGGRLHRDGVLGFLDHGTSDIARTYCLMLLLFFRSTAFDERWKAETNPGALLYVPEFLVYDRGDPIKRWVAFNIRLDNIRKKLTPHQPFDPSWLVKLKNIALNLREGRAPSTSR